MNATMIRLLVVSLAVLTTAAWPSSAHAAAPVLDPIANMTIGSGGCSPSSADQAISATDPDGDAITFTFSGPTFMTLTSNPQVGNTRTGNIHLSSPPPGTSGNFPASVTATANGESDTKAFTISVIFVNQPPVLNQPANMTVNEGATANQTLTGSDPCGAPLTFTKVGGPTFMTVTTVNANTGNINLAPSFSDQGTYNATVRASNGTLSNDKSFAITVNHVHRAPVLAQPANMTVNEGATANQSITATDPDGDAITFTFSGPTFMTVTSNPQVGNTRTGNINLAPGFSDSGTYSATVRATDTFPLSNDKTFTITVNDVNRAPVLAQPANMTVTEGSTANQTLAATDPDGNAITFTKVSGPTYMTVTTMSPTMGNVNLAPGFTDAGTTTVVVRVTDNGTPPLSSDRSFTVTVNCLNRAHVLNQPANMTVNEGATANQTLTATDPDGNPITFSKVSGPTYVTVTTTSPGTGTATGNVNVAPGFSDAGTAVVTVAASADDCGGIVSVSKSFTVTVNNVCSGAPSLSPTSNMLVQEGTTADQTVTATSPTGEPMVFTAALPSFATLTSNPQVGNTRTANIHVAPPIGTTPGDYPASVTVTATGSCPGSRTASFTITVNNVNRAPTLNPIANMTVPEAATADQAISGSDPDGDALTFSKVSGPTFMTVTTTSATTGNIHLAPGFADAGAYNATVRASDGSLSAERGLTITVCNACARAPVLNPIANMTVNEGATANQTVSAADPDGDPLTLSFTGPIFMTLTTFPSSPGSATGNIHLAPGFSDAGTYTSTVRASDGAFTDSKSFTIVVTPVCSGQPVADPGGPYQGFVNVPLQFDGSGSSDPSGGALTFAWEFGDGATATGVMPVHTYTALGTYSVVLTVTGECGTSSGSTTAEIRPACDALAFTRGGNRTIRLNSGRPSACVQIEPQEGCYRNEDVILSSIVMKYTGGAVTEIHAISDKTVIDADTNGDGIAEITACFRKEDLRQLFSGLPGGESNPVVTLEGALATGGRFQTALELRVISSGGAATASVSPNPFNPAGTLTFTTARAGRAKVELFDVGGRLVRTILDEPSLAAGVHEVRIDGRGLRGENLASGIYFIRGVSAEGEFTNTIAILK